MQLTKVGTFEGYPIYISDREDKKYMADVDGKFVHFGQKGMAQFHDKMGRYWEYDHNDNLRRELYYRRHRKNYGRGSADWFAKNILW